MFEYQICNQADVEIFKKQCVALENSIPRLVKSDILIDVDGSKIQAYLLERSKILVINSYYLNEVYIKSEIDLVQFFK